jgi:DNA repair ATPase RecN
VQEINRKRIEILTKRLEKFGKIHENCDVINAQCAATEDVLQLIRDQSVTLRDPQQVSDQLEGLVHDVEQTEETVREVEAIFEMATPDPTPIAGFSALTSDSAAPSAAPRTRLRN